MTDQGDKQPAADAAGLDPKKTEVLDRIAAFVVRRNLAPAAILFLESTRPLHHIGAQAAIFFEPFLYGLLQPGQYEALREAFEDKRYVDYLTDKITTDANTDTKGSRG